MKTRENIKVTPTQDDSVHTQDLTNKYVVLSEKYYKGDDLKRVFRCEGGFGCHPGTMGSAIFGTMIYSGERFRAERHEIQRMATEEEVKQAQEIREREKKLLVKFKHDWIEGFKLFTGEQWKNYVHFVENTVQFPRMQRMGKECIEYIWPKDYFKDIEFKEISERDFYVLQEVFGDTCGCFGYFTL